MKIVQPFGDSEAKSRRELAIYFLPNLFTSGNLFCGFYSVIASLHGDFERAAVAIFVAGIFDFMDGRIARLTKAYSRFGEEYDSLADLVSFGAAPAVMMYLWALKPFGRIGWLAAFLFLACGALRLARFNVQSQVVEKRHFQGLPIPIAASITATIVLFFLEYLQEGVKNHFVLSLTLSLAFLMVSNIRYRSFKDFDLKNTRSFGYLVIAVVTIIVLATRPALTLLVVLGFYALSGIIDHIFHHKKYSQPQHQSETDENEEEEKNNYEGKN
ncbi:MAG: CDP-diacylglycerol--serine O-phosphatidyltransferase [Deltaproteobacteria bacterium]|nr:CDP-diacylglycerol--serine O-phosphatidyltransferase [Deltaproteobacteria bacterium]